jgi:hypothetical protein
VKLRSRLGAIAAALVVVAAVVTVSAVFTYRHAPRPPASVPPPTTLAAEFTQLETRLADGDIDRPECWAVFDEGAPEAYNVPAIVGFFSVEYLDTHDMHNAWQTARGVVAFHDAATAQDN